MKPSTELLNFNNDFSLINIEGKSKALLTELEIEPANGTFYYHIVKSLLIHFFKIYAIAEKNNPTIQDVYQFLFNEKYRTEMITKAKSADCSEAQKTINTSIWISYTQYFGNSTQQDFIKYSAPLNIPLLSIIEKENIDKIPS